MIDEIFIIYIFLEPKKSYFFLPKGVKIVPTNY